MSFSTYNGFLGEDIPSIEQFSLDEKLLPLDYHLIIDTVSSIPLYDRLDFKNESLCVSWFFFSFYFVILIIYILL